MMKIQNRPLIKVGDDIDVPLIGSIFFGLIDRGTNLIQVRPNSFCVLSCIFCSTDAGPRSCWRRAEYYVKVDLLIEWFKPIAKLKGKNVEAHIDTVGDPLLYDKLPDLIHKLKDIQEVKVVSLQTHAPVLTEKYADRLWSAGLDRINLSIDTLDEKKGKYLQGVDWYSVNKVMKVTEYILNNTGIDITLAPVLLPGINNDDIPKIIEWGLKIGVGKRYPPFGIQKYLKHKHGRKPKNTRFMSWRNFIKLLSKWEKVYRVKLILKEEDFNIVKTVSIPITYKLGEKVRVKIIAPGWLRNEWLAVPIRRQDRVITVIDDNIEIGSKVSARIISNKHNIYVARI
jgi:hypothetical protein